MLKIIKRRLISFNPLDYVLVLLILVGGIFWATKFFKKTEYVYVDLINLKNSYSGLVDASESWQVENIKKGDRIFNNYGDDTAVVDDIEKYVWGNGKQTNTNLTIKILSTYNENQKVYLFGGNSIKIGEKLEVDFGNNKFTGLIRNVYKNKEDRFLGYKSAKAVIWVRLRGYEKEHLERLKNFVEKDFNGREVVKVVEVKMSPSEVYVVTKNDSDIYLGNDSTKADAVVKAELNDVKCKTDSICFYNNGETFAVGSLFSADNGDTWFGADNVIIDRKIIYE